MIQKNKLISIIVPIYNTSRYLEKCLISIKNQTYTQYEVIMIDDGSTDDSASIAKKFQKKYSNFYLYTNEHHGVSSTRNFGVQKAKGYYIAFIDSDDFVHKDYLKTLIENSGERNNLTACNFFIQYKDVKGFSKFADEKRVHFPITFTKYTLWEERFKPYYTIAQNFFTSVLWNKLFVADIVKTIPFVFENGEDQIFVMKYADKMNTITFISSAMYYHTLSNAKSLTKRRDKQEKYLDKIKVVIAQYNFFKEKKYPNIITYKSGQLAAYTFFEYRNQFPAKKNKEVKKIIFQTFKKNFYKKEAIMSVLYYFSKKLYRLRHKHNSN